MDKIVINEKNFDAKMSKLEFSFKLNKTNDNIIVISPRDRKPYSMSIRYNPKTMLSPINNIIIFLLKLESSEDLIIHMDKCISFFGYMENARKKNSIVYQMILQKKLIISEEL